jgi:hypothetical protein
MLSVIVLSAIMLTVMAPYLQPNLGFTSDARMHCRMLL